jgi:hypothetical protein
MEWNGLDRWTDEMIFNLDTLFQVDPSKNVSVFGKFLYDATNERVRIIEDVDVAGKKYFYDFIMLYRKANIYTFIITYSK